MAKKANRIHIKLKSTESPYVYHTNKNKQTTPARLERKKYDPVLKKHVLFKEEK
jgi:large subunit ribosomal protein L33